MGFSEPELPLSCCMGAMAAVLGSWPHLLPKQRMLSRMLKSFAKKWVPKHNIQSLPLNSGALEEEPAAGNAGRA